MRDLQYDSPVTSPDERKRFTPDTTVPARYTVTVGGHVTSGLTVAEAYKLWKSAPDGVNVDMRQDEV